ncbi:MAG: NERD domain-containing protein [Bacteroidales bacterium]|nr:NERD domain-containing protein [Bacteroidales bacterium]
MTLTTILIAASIVFIAVIVWRFATRKSKGEIGEEHVAKILSKLPLPEYRTINDVYITDNEHSTQIDHIVISECAIFVIETKFYNGEIYGGENSEKWSQYIYKNQFQFRNPILQNRGHIVALRKALKLNPEIPVVSIITFSDQAYLHITTETKVVYWEQLLNTILSYEQKFIPMSVANKIYSDILNIKAANATNKKLRKTHINNVQVKINQSNNAIRNGQCPRCGAKLVLKKGKFGAFYGCINYPECKYTLNL